MRLLIAIILSIFCSISYAKADTQAELIHHALQMEIKYNLPDQLLRNICKVESNWRNVKGQLDEIGVCQLRPGTVRHYFPELTRASTSYFKYGDVGVHRIQERLAALGLYKGRIDGIWGPLTHQAVLSFQNEASLKVDGIVGPVTWKALVGTRYPNRTIEQRLWVPKENIEIAAMLLNKLREEVGGDRHILAAAYNGGSGHPIVQYMRKVNGRY